MLAELEGVSPELLDDEKFLRHALGEALTQADATVLEVVSKQFDPQGVTVLALLSESHASIHTYPEVGKVFVDVFTCGTRAKPALAVQLLADALGAVSARSDLITRGARVPALVGEEHA
ncbi:S-adenosylmethionine decarboxylase [Saccharothrix violaceirubra]|uniref:S-adenosylmethionine decarboxylase n=1 Tax=Saccharothrix violaceirubra TaxID=413306 RepID=A0A7W7WUE2_9PSEU|nr:S-adenosylmethionine decarboxylase [Saccharothrix violaceirubra]